MNKILNGYFKAGCHQLTCFSTYHNINNGICLWCNKTERDLIKAGAIWLIWPSKQLELPFDNQ